MHFIEIAPEYGFDFIAAIIDVRLEPMMGLQLRLRLCCFSQPTSELQWSATSSEDGFYLVIN